MTATDAPTQEQNPAPRSFAALHHKGFRAFFVCMALGMMADNIEHVISYWVIFEKFESPMLAGFAVIAHWVPFLLFSIHAGALADKFDPRRVIQWGLVLFILVSLAWGFLFYSDTLEMWHAVVLLVVHGFAGVLWGPAANMMVHDIVGSDQLQSGVRLSATARTLGILMGPAIGGGLLLLVGPAWGIIINAAIYVPYVVWLIKAPYGHGYRKKIGDIDHSAPPPRAIKGFSDIVQTFKEVADNRVIVSITLLAGAASLLVGNAYQPLMPGFARDLGATEATFLYSALLTASAAGALTAGIVLEMKSLMLPQARTAFRQVILWCILMAGFAFATNFYLALLLLFAAGFLELSYKSMNQTLVQLRAPVEIRGRVIGLYSSSSLGLITFSGVTVGFGAELVGIHFSLGYSALALLVVTIGLYSYSEIKKRQGEAAEAAAE
ncbi:MAG: MFS transporter [Rhodospirillaceae bacterium]|jgi:MFS family permease|nr:MFS transporter [Rhodospirillaceae bacterium]